MITTGLLGVKYQQTPLVKIFIEFVCMDDIFQLSFESQILEIQFLLVTKRKCI